MRKLTNLEFITKAKEVHGDKYDYSKTEYMNAQTKVCIICPEHGEFWQKPYNHLNGNGCPSCIRHEWDTKSFIEKARKIHGNKYDYSKVEFKTTRDKVCIICHDLDKDGKEIGEFWQYPLTHLNGHGCERERKGIKEECWEERICPICEKTFKERKKYDKLCCSKECRKKYIEIHKDEINKKRSETLKETFSKKTKEDYNTAHEKQKKTCLKKYGVESFSKTEKGRNISRNNMKKMRKINSEKIKNEILIPKYQEICENDDLELIEFRSRFDCTVKCKKCGNIFTTKTLGYLTDDTITRRCKICNPYLTVLKKDNGIENEFSDFLKDCGIKFYQNYREIINPMELDFYLPDHNVAFEIDGIYWHSEIYKDKTYHLEKTKKCNEKGINLIHIFEDEWTNKKDICKSRIKNILGITENKIFARKCTISSVSKKEASYFLNKNHIQGYSVFKHGYGLYYNNELVSLMTFGKLRRNLGQKSKDGCYEMIRFCNKLNTNVIGGASKLLNHFIKEFNPKEIISYSDIRWSIGKLYLKLGFKLNHETEPNYFYVINNKRVNRFALRKNVLVEKYGCTKEETEHDFCIKQHWYRIYDCGNKVWSIKPQLDKIQK